MLHCLHNQILWKKHHSFSTLLMRTSIFQFISSFSSSSHAFNIFQLEYKLFSVHFAWFLTYRQQYPSFSPTYNLCVCVSRFICIVIRVGISTMPILGGAVAPYGIWKFHVIVYHFLYCPCWYSKLYTNIKILPRVNVISTFCDGRFLKSSLKDKSSVFHSSFL